jgi:hypothetical protein
MQDRQLDKEKIIELAVKEPEINEVILAKLAGFNDEEIQFIETFWDYAFNDSWIYISNDMVVNWLGYKKGKSTMSDFYTKNLLKNYEVDVEFKEINQNDEIIKKFYSDLNRNEKPGNRAKFYIVTGECLKGLLMSASTEKGKMVRKLYIKTEKLVKIMIMVLEERKTIEFKEKLLIKDKEVIEYKEKIEIKDMELEVKDKEVNEYKEKIEVKDMELGIKEKELEVKDEENQILKAKALDLKSEIKNLEVYKKNGYIYITTTKQYAMNNVFRVGKTINLDKRLQQYEVGRVQDDQLYYCFVYESANVALLEIILCKFLTKYKEDPTKNKDIFVLSFHILKSYVESICKQFNENMVKCTNDMIGTNIDFIEDKDPNSIPSIPEPYLFSRPKDIDDDTSVFTSRPKYYEQIVGMYAEYDVKFLTKSEDVKFLTSIIDLECKHQRRQVEVRTLLKSLGCTNCIKDKRLADKIKELTPAPIDMKLLKEEYKAIDLVDENSAKFSALKTIVKNRIITQNIIIDKLAEENMILTSKYERCNYKLTIVCNYKHTNTISWNGLKLNEEKYCKTCRNLGTEIIKSASNKHATEEEKKRILESIGWTYIKKTGKGGYIDCMCPNGHIVSKAYRELKNGSCSECKNMKK